MPCAAFWGCLPKPGQAPCRTGAQGSPCLCAKAKEEKAPPNLHRSFSLLCFTCFFTAKARLFVLFWFPCGYKQGRAAQKKLVSLKSPVPSRARARGREDTHLASVLRAVWSRGWVQGCVPKEKRQDQGNKAVFLSLQHIMHWTSNSRNPSRQPGHAHSLTFSPGTG